MKNMLLTIAFALFAGSAYSSTWIAVCNDGKNIQYNQTKDGTGFLYMKVKDARNRTHTYQIARLKQTFHNGVAICGTVLENGTGNTGTPITQVCANKSRKNIYVKYKHPYEDRPIASGIFCKATVSVR